MFFKKKVKTTTDQAVEPHAPVTASAPASPKDYVVMRPDDERYRSIVEPIVKACIRARTSPYKVELHVTDYCEVYLITNGNQKKLDTPLFGAANVALAYAMTLNGFKRRYTDAIWHDFNAVHGYRNQRKAAVYTVC